MPVPITKPDFTILSKELKRIIENGEIKNGKIVLDTRSLDQIMVQLDQLLNTLVSSVNNTNTQLLSTASGIINLGTTGQLIAVPTGLKFVAGVTAAVYGPPTIGNNFWVSAQRNPQIPSAIDLAGWKPTAVANTTPVLVTTGLTVTWVAHGTAV